MGRLERFDPNAEPALTLEGGKVVKAREREVKAKTSRLPRRTVIDETFDTLEVFARIARQIERM